MTPPHLQPVIQMVKAASVTVPPPPWRLVTTYAVGGVVAVGFGDGGEMLLVVSHSGRGLFDCETGNRTARDRDDDGFDALALTARGIGALEGQTLRMSGLHGGGLPKVTEDGWFAERLVLDWPDESLLLTPPGSSLYGALHGRPHDFTKVFKDGETRAWGFSWTGRTLLLATSSDITIYGRS